MPLKRCQQVPAPYKRLIHDEKRNCQTDFQQTDLTDKIDGSKPTNDKKIHTISSLSTVLQETL